MVLSFIASAEGLTLTTAQRLAAAALKDSTFGRGASAICSAVTYAVI